MYPVPVWAREPRIKPNYSHKKYLSFPRNIPNSVKKVLLYTNVTETNMLSAKQSYLASQKSTSKRTCELNRQAFVVRQIMQEMQLEALGVKNTSLLPRQLVEENRHLAMFHNLFYMGGKDLPMHQRLDRFFIKSLQNARENDKVLKSSKAGGAEVGTERGIKLPEVTGRAREDQWGIQKVPQCVPGRDLVDDLPAKPIPRNVHTSLAVQQSHDRNDVSTVRGFQNVRSRTLPSIVLGKSNNEQKQHVQFTEEGKENTILPNFPVHNRGKAAKFRRETTVIEDVQTDRKLEKNNSGNRKSPSFVMFKDMRALDCDKTGLQDGYMFYTQAEEAGRLSMQQLLMDNKNWSDEESDNEH